jgi:hypothetical protein
VSLLSVVFGLANTSGSANSCSRLKEEKDEETTGDHVSITCQYAVELKKFFL